MSKSRSGKVGGLIRARMPGTISQPVAPVVEAAAAPLPAPAVRHPNEMRGARNAAPALAVSAFTKSRRVGLPLLISSSLLRSRQEELTTETQRERSEAGMPSQRVPACPG